MQLGLSNTILKVALITALIVVASGCAAAPIHKLVNRDLDSAIAMAKVAGTEQEAQCFEAMRAATDKMQEIEALDSDGLIASTYKVWLLRYYRARITESLAQSCMPVIAGMGANLMIR